MNFAGIQKLTLLDFPDKTACTLFTQGCNFACPFCQNASLIGFGGGADMLTQDDVLKFLDSRKGLLTGVCISGGEPLAQRDIADFAKQVKDMGFAVKIDTNGSFPDKLIKLVEVTGIDYVAMDIKNTPGKYARTTGLKEYDTSAVLKSINYLLQNNVGYEFRTTVVRDFHTQEDLLEIAKLISAAGKYYLQCFDNPDMALRQGLSAYTPEEMQEILAEVRKVLNCTQLRGVV